MIWLLGNTWCWQSVDETIHEPVGVSSIRELSNKFELCITGEVSVQYHVLCNSTQFLHVYIILLVTGYDVPYLIGGCYI